jgi:hypothetical protein
MLYAKAPFWFAGLLILVILGFWPSYFSPASEKATFGQHFHSIVMLIWVLMLIVQPWLINHRKRDTHRLVGRFSFVIGPLVVISALYVVLDNLLGLPQPYPPIGLSFFWLGLGSALFFAMLFILAIISRRQMPLHARYMVATGLLFITPGLGRLFERIGEATGYGIIGFPLALWLPVVIGSVMIYRDARSGAPLTPWTLATLSWTLIVLGFHWLPRFAWFSTFADWYRGFA